jgi:hypothetical protein
VNYHQSILILARTSTYLHPLWPSTAIDTLNMDSPSFASPCPTSPGSRRCDSPVDDQAEIRTHSSRDSAVPEKSASPAAYDADRVNLWDHQPRSATSQDHRTRRVHSTNTVQRKQTIVTKGQHRLLQQWCEEFVQPESMPVTLDERMIALAKALEMDPKVVVDYVRQRRRRPSARGCDLDAGQHDSDSPRSVEAAQFRTEPYTLIEANSHLSPTILPVVDRYVSTCRRRRSQNDGRRSVNTGPYRCTFGCGYRTKRAFDWRRHEETHEPQELWLCSICRHNDIHNPFLVNRKDKFLKHVTDKHADVPAETVLECSKLEFVPRAELVCSLCSEESATWDERCRHVLGHFEDQVERSMKRVKIVHEEREDEERVTQDNDDGAVVVKVS